MKYWALKPDCWGYIKGAWGSGYKLSDSEDPETGSGWTILSKLAERPRNYCHQSLNPLLTALCQFDSQLCPFPAV